MSIFKHFLGIFKEYAQYIQRLNDKWTSSYYTIHCVVVVHENVLLLC
jgi:hypothetical protein